MAAVQQNNDYNFDMFDVHTRTHGNAAPARKPRPEAPLKVVKPQKNRVQTKKEAQAATVNSLIIIAFAAVFLVMLCMHINAGVKSYEISREIADIQAEIEAAKSENVRLNAQLNSFTSIGNVDDYATRVLGMSKIEGYQVEYIDLSQDDGVIYYSGGGGLLSLFSRP